MRTIMIVRLKYLLILALTALLHTNQTRADDHAFDESATIKPVLHAVGLDSACALLAEVIPCDTLDSIWTAVDGGRNLCSSLIESSESELYNVMQAMLFREPFFVDYYGAWDSLALETSVQAYMEHYGMTDSTVAALRDSIGLEYGDFQNAWRDLATIFFRVLASDQDVISVSLSQYGVSLLSLNSDNESTHFAAMPKYFHALFIARYGHIGVPRSTFDTVFLLRPLFIKEFRETIHIVFPLWLGSRLQCQVTVVVGTR